MSIKNAVMVNLALAAVACRGPADPTDEPVCPSAQPIVVEAPNPKPVSRAMLQREVEWRGARHVLALHPDGRLVVGRHEGMATIPAQVINAFADQAWMRVINFGHAEHSEAILLSLPEGDGEDPPSRYQVFVAVGGALLRIYDGTLGVYGITELRPVGSGQLQYVEDGWTACDRLGHPKVAEREAVTLGLDPEGRLAERARVGTGASQRCDDLAG